MSEYTIKDWDWVTLWGRYWLPMELGILVMVKWSMFSFGCEIWRHGFMVFVGPLAVGFGTVSETEVDTGGSEK